MIDLEKDDGVWTVTINRPEKANSLTLKMLQDLTQIARDAKAARVLILTGAGKVFSAGADLEAARAGLAVSPIWEELSGFFSKASKLHSTHTVVWKAAIVAKHFC